MLAHVSWEKIKDWLVNSERLRNKHGCACRTCARLGAKAEKLGQSYISSHAVVDFIRDRFEPNNALLVILAAFHRFRVLSTGQNYYCHRGVDCFVLQQRNVDADRSSKFIVTSEEMEQGGTCDVPANIVYRSLQDISCLEECGNSS